MMTARVEELRCPKCGLADSVRKVSVAAISSDPEDIALARRVATPRRPRYRSPWGVWSKLAVGCLVLGLAIILVATEQNVLRLWLAGVPVDPLVAYLLLSNVAFLLPIGLIVVHKERQRAVRQQELSLAMQSWERAIDRWERLYHCARCEGVFLRDWYRLVPTGETERALYEAVPAFVPGGEGNVRLAG